MKMVSYRIGNDKDIRLRSRIGYGFGQVSHNRCVGIE